MKLFIHGALTVNSSSKTGDCQWCSGFKEFSAAPQWPEWASQLGLWVRACSRLFEVLPCLLSGSLSQVVSSAPPPVRGGREDLANLVHPGKRIEVSLTRRFYACGAFFYPQTMFVFRGKETKPESGSTDPGSWSDELRWRGAGTFSPLGPWKFSPMFPWSKRKHREPFRL